MSSHWSIYFRFPDLTFVCIYLLPHTCHMLCPSYGPCFAHPDSW